ncbi:MAG: PEP-CTERM sorting domain-containing protein, partial [Candidatus Acidiferrales bacterium]
MLVAATPAFASGVSFNFNLPGGKLGTSQSYTSNTFTVTAYGYKCDASSATSTKLTKCAGSDLYGKNGGVGETGLGLNGENDQEIGWNGKKSDYVLGLDVSSLFAGHMASLTLDFGSVQKGENYTVWGYASNPFGTNVTLSNQLLSVFGNSNSTADYTSTISLNSNDQFLVITSQCGDVLLDSLSGTAPSPTPEPGTLALFGTGLLLAGFIMRRRLAGRSA